VSGGSYFFTVVLSDRRSTLLTDHVDLLRKVLRGVQTQQPFKLIAMVVLPDHLHCIWTLPEGDCDYPTRWKKLKADFSRGLPKYGDQLCIRQNKGERGIWQRRYWEHAIRNDQDWIKHMDYIHYNPVKHGYVTRVRDWPHSTFHQYVRLGIYPSDWGGGHDNSKLSFGER
jgi:putative transposase